MQTIKRAIANSLKHDGIQVVLLRNVEGNNETSILFVYVTPVEYVERNQRHQMNGMTSKSKRNHTDGEWKVM